MSANRGPLEIVRDAFDRMRDPVPVDVPVKQTLEGWHVRPPSGVSDYAEVDGLLSDLPFVEADPVRFGFRTKLPDTKWYALINNVMGQDRLPPADVPAAASGSMVDRLARAYLNTPVGAGVGGPRYRDACRFAERFLAEMQISITQPMVDRTLAVIEKRVAALEIERDGWKAMAKDECAAFNRVVAERDALRAHLAAFTAHNVRPLDDKPGFPLRAIAPSKRDPRRLGGA